MMAALSHLQAMLIVEIYRGITGATGSAGRSRSRQVARFRSHHRRGYGGRQTHPSGGGLYSPLYLFKQAGAGTVAAD